MLSTAPGSGPNAATRRAQHAQQREKEMVQARRGAARVVTAAEHIRVGECRARAHEKLRTGPSHTALLVAPLSQLRTQNRDDMKVTSKLPAPGCMLEFRKRKGACCVFPWQAAPITNVVCTPNIKCPAEKCTGNATPGMKCLKKTKATSTACEPVRAFFMGCQSRGTRGLDERFEHRDTRMG